jgi:hypothetical protein
LNVVGALNLGGTSALNVVGTLDGTTTYTLANYRTLTGSFATANVPPTYVIDYGPRVSAGTIRLVPVPEPASALGACAAALACWRLRRRKTT